MKSNRRGFTLFEMIVTGAMIGAIIVVFARFMPQIQTFIRRIQIQQQLQSEASTVMDTINRFLRNGRSTSVVICSCNNTYCQSTAPACNATVNDPPNSQINFVTADGHWRRFYWVNRDLMMDDNPAGVPAPPGPNVLSRRLARNVPAIMFTGDSRDLSVIDVSLEIEAPLDAATDANGFPLHVTTLLLPTQRIRMVASQ